MDNFNIKEAEKLRQKLDKQIQEYYAKQELDKYKKLSAFVGKCYKSKKQEKYYKVLSNYARNNNHLTCLTFKFDETEEYNFENTISVETKANGFHSMYPRLEIYFGDSFYDIDDVFCFGGGNFFDCVDEIAEEEFEVAMDRKYQEIKRKINNVPKEVKRIR